MRHIYLCLATFLLSSAIIRAQDNSGVDSTQTQTADTVSNSEILPSVLPENEKSVKNDSAKTLQGNGTMPYDTIFQKSGFAIICTIKDKNLYEVEYIKKGEKLLRKISTRNLKALHYSSGRIEVIDNTPEKKDKDWVPPVAEIDWKKVKVAYEEIAVAGMIELGEIEAEYEAKKMNMGNDVLERNAIIILQKKAYTMDAKAILILSKDVRREYGEIPSIKMKAMAYKAQ